MRKNIFVSLILLPVIITSCANSIVKTGFDLVKNKITDEYNLKSAKDISFTSKEYILTFEQFTEDTGGRICLYKLDYNASEKNNLEFYIYHDVDKVVYSISEDRYNSYYSLVKSGTIEGKISAF